MCNGDDHMNSIYNGTDHHRSICYMLFTVYICLQISSYFFSFSLSKSISINSASSTALEMFGPFQNRSWIENQADVAHAHRFTHAYPNHVQFFIRKKNIHNNNWWIRLHQWGFDCAKPSWKSINKMRSTRKITQAHKHTHTRTHSQPVTIWKISRNVLRKSVHCFASTFGMGFVCGNCWN